MPKDSVALKWSCARVKGILNDKSKGDCVEFCFLEWYLGLGNLETGELMISTIEGRFCLF